MSASVSDCVNYQRKLSQNITQGKTSQRMSHRVKACLTSAGTRAGCHAEKYLQIFTPSEFPLKVKPLPKCPKNKHWLVTSCSVMDIFWFRQFKTSNSDPQVRPSTDMEVNWCAALFLIAALYFNPLIASISTPWLLRFLTFEKIWCTTLCTSSCGGLT